MVHHQKILLILVSAGFLIFSPPVFGTPSPETDHGSETTIQQLKQAVESNPASVKAHNDLGQELLRQERYLEAMEEFRKALAIEPYYPFGPLFSGNIYTDAEVYQKASEEFQEVIRTNREYSRAHSNLGLAYMNLGNYEVAKKEFEEAIKINPDFAEAHRHLGMLLRKTGKNEEAEAEFRLVSNLDPGRDVSSTNSRYTQDSLNAVAPSPSLEQAVEKVATLEANENQPSGENQSLKENSGVSDETTFNQPKIKVLTVTNYHKENQSSEDKVLGETTESDQFSLAAPENKVSLEGDQKESHVPEEGSSDGEPVSAIGDWLFDLPK